MVRLRARRALLGRPGQGADQASDARSRSSVGNGFGTMSNPPPGVAPR